ncbi:phosphomannomutase [Geothermobacter hydrogeniphilus]|uniref:Phosphomannomutase n=1 Tax=Geothermobacter hydrogeniphilus TaxID=1969733 RepID=A0A2K2HEF5_9BACT|nr:phosphomannomutase [Geothermobacter hydrogeniphilus]PNU21639.1 phosphomannomutase [Geothermobacter hydrogeniphilus]
MNLNCFKAYDIRGRLPDELNEEIAWRIGRAYAAFLKPRTVVVGRDVRLSSEALTAALSRGLTEGGADVVDIGLCGTEEVYFATDYGRHDGGIMVTASHNPADFNGMKLVREGARPISGDSGLSTIRELVAGGDFPAVERIGGIREENYRGPYIRHLLGYLGEDGLRRLKIVANPGNGCAGPVLKLLEAQLPFEFIPVHFEPDGSFPNGIPNPLLPENRSATADAVLAVGADFGVAWDGDFDRCFLFDERGRFIEGYYIVGLLAEALLGFAPGAKIIHDPRLTWNTVEVVERAGGTPIMSKTGHAFIKERMRAEDALYGGEMSAHHYFRDFAYCDSGMIPWLLVAGLVCRSGKPLSALVDERIAAYPSSGEINRQVADPAVAMRRVEDHYAGQGGAVDRTDGLSIDFADWRFNLRPSNTEPVLRLNVEARGDRALMENRTAEILDLLDT